MFYLISQYLWWLLVALVFGMMVGWATSDRNPDRRLGWLWPVMVAAVIAFALTWLRAINGVPALWTETALLFLGTYLGGCWIGGMLKTIFSGERLAASGVPDWQSNLGAPGPGIMGGAQPGGVRAWHEDLGQAQRELGESAASSSAKANVAGGAVAASVAAAPAGPMTAWAAHVETPPPGVPNWLLNLGEPGPGYGGGLGPAGAGWLSGGVPDWTRDLGQTSPKAAEPAQPFVATQVAPSLAADPPLMAAVEGEAAIAGQRPAGFVSPRGGRADDLKLIRGIGRQNEGRLHGLGIWHFDQIAAWSRENIDWVGSYLAFPGRIDREDWVKQAQTLAAGKETEFAKRVKWGLVGTSRDDGSLGQGNIETLEPRPGASGAPPKARPPKG